MRQPVVVRHSRGSYPVTIGPGSLERLGDLVQDALGRRRLAMIADATVDGLYRAGRWSSPTWTGETLTVAPGESSKSRETWARLTDELLTRRFGRDSGLIGLGGGVISDLSGFVAATYMRGIPYVLVPTTLVAMLDASVGGKTGVNAPQGKNLIGAFHPPAGVLADPLTLLTLPDREYRGGLAEAVKHGLIADRGYFEWIESRVEPILGRDPDTLAYLVRRSVEIKASVVSEDEQEVGRRAILNAGHTVGHALEQSSGYRLSHGEAVGLGLVAECAIAERMAIASPGLGARVAALLGSLGLPVRVPPGVVEAAPLDLMASDKKNREQRVHFALPAGLGVMHQGAAWTVPGSSEDIQTGLTVIGAV